MNMADPATKLRQYLATLVGEADANAILSNLSGAATDLESLGPLLGLAKVRDGRMSDAEYLERYGHRGPHEMELSAPGPEDDPAWLEKRLAEFIGRKWMLAVCWKISAPKPRPPGSDSKPVSRIR